MEVRITESELRLAVEVGVQRRMSAMRRNAKHTLGFSRGDMWAADIEGACGELVVAKALGIYWSGDFGRVGMVTDVGPYAVRQTNYPDGHLLLHDHDKDDGVFILVTGRAPVFTICGWITGREGKKRGEWKDPTGKHPAIFIEQTLLWPFSALKERLIKHAE